MADFDLEHVGEIMANPERFTNFTAQLYRLIAKADRINRQRIRRGFPDEVRAFEKWERSEVDRELTRDSQDDEIAP